MRDGEMLVATPARWDKACFSMPAVRALMATGRSVGVICEERQRLFWERIVGERVVNFLPKAKAKEFTSRIAGRWSAAVIWEQGTGAEAVVKADNRVERFFNRLEHFPGLRRDTKNDPTPSLR